MGGETTPNRAVMQRAGYGYRLPAQVPKREFDRAGSILHLLLRYAHALITQMAQTATSHRRTTRGHGSSWLRLNASARHRSAKLHCSHFGAACQQN
jgi:hypothetical protein